MPEEFDLGRALFSLFVNSDEFKARMAEAEKSAHDKTGRMGEEFKRLGATVAGTFAVTVAGAIMTSLNAMREYASELRVLSQETGSAAKDIAAFGEMFEKAGLGMSGFARSMTVLNAQIEATVLSATPASTALGRMIGPVRDLQGNVMGATEAFERVIAAVNAMGTEQEKVAKLSEIFGRRQAAVLMAIVKQGEKGVDAFRQELKKAGIDIDLMMADEKQWHELQVDLNRQFRSLAIVLGKEFLPVVIAYVKHFTESLQSIRQFIREHEAWLGVLIKIVGVLGALRAGQMGTQLLGRAATFALGGQATGALSGAAGALAPLALPAAAVAGVGYGLKGTADIAGALLGGKSFMEAYTGGPEARRWAPLLQPFMPTGPRAGKGEFAEVSQERLAEQAAQYWEKVKGGTKEAREQVGLIIDRMDKLTQSFQLGLMPLSVYTLYLERLSQAIISTPSPVDPQKLAHAIQLNIDALNRQRDAMRQSFEEFRAPLRLTRPEEIQLQIKEEMVAREMLRGQDAAAVRESNIKIARLRKELEDEQHQRAMALAKDRFEFEKANRVVSLKEEIQFEQGMREQLLRTEESERRQSLIREAGLWRQLAEEHFNFMISRGQLIKSQFDELARLRARAEQPGAETLTPGQMRREEQRREQQNVRELMQIFAHGGTEQQIQFAENAVKQIVEQVRNSMKLGEIVPAQQQLLLQEGARFLERRYGEAVDISSILGTATKLTNRVMEPVETRIGLQTGTASDTKIYRSDLSVLTTDLSSRLATLVSATTTSTDNLKAAIDALTAKFREAVGSLAQIQAGAPAALPGAAAVAAQRPTAGVSTTEASVAAEVERALGRRADTAGTSETAVALTRAAQQLTATVDSLGQKILAQGGAAPVPVSPTAAAVGGGAILKVQSDINVRGEISPQAAEALAEVTARKLQDALGQQLGGGR